MSATAEMERLLHPIVHAPSHRRIADWDLEPAIALSLAMKKESRCRTNDDGTDDTTQQQQRRLAEELNLLEWVQGFATTKVLFVNDDRLLQVLTQSVQQTIARINEKQTTSMDLCLGDAVVIAIPPSFLQLPRVLLSALAEAPAPPSSFDGDQRRYQALFLYLLCQLVTDLYAYSHPQQRYSLAEWLKYWQQNLLRHTNFSRSSRLVQSVVALYWFDAHLLHASFLPYDWDWDCLEQLFLEHPPRRDTRWDYIAQELTPSQLDSFFVTSVAVERLLRAHGQDDKAWLLARQWFQAHLAMASRYLEQYKSSPPKHDSFFGMTPGVDPVLSYLRVGCYFDSLWRWPTALHLARDAAVLGYPAQVRVYQSLYQHALWHDPGLVLGWNDRRTETLALLWALWPRPDREVAIHVLFCELIAVRDGVADGLDGEEEEIRSYLHALLMQTLWRLVVEYDGDTVAIDRIPEEYLALLLDIGDLTDAVTLGRRVQRLLETTLALPSLWQPETWDDQWRLVWLHLFGEEVEEMSVDEEEHFVEYEDAVKGPVVEDAAVAEIEHVVVEMDREDGALNIEGVGFVEKALGTTSRSLRETRKVLEPIEENVDEEEEEDKEEEDNNKEENCISGDRESSAANVAMDDSDGDDDVSVESVGVVYTVEYSSEEDDEDWAAVEPHDARDEPEEEENAAMFDDGSTKKDPRMEDSGEESTSHTRDDDLEELEEEEEEEKDDTEHPKSTAPSLYHHGSELTDWTHDRNDPNNEAGYEAEYSQDAATEEENEEPFVGESGVLDTASSSGMPPLAVQESSVVDLAPALMPIVMRNEASTLVDKRYEPESQGQTDVEGVPQPLQILEAGYDAEDCHGHTEDEEVFDEEDEHLPDNFPSAMVLPPSNGPLRVPPHLPRQTLSTDEMVADDEAESSEIEGEGLVEPSTTTEPPFEEGGLLIQLATTVQNVHFFKQPETPSQETRSFMQPSYEPIPTASDEAVDVPETDEESESLHSFRSHPGDEILCSLSVASSPQSSLGMQSAAKSDAPASSSSFVTATMRKTTKNIEKPKALSVMNTAASSTSSNARSRTSSVRPTPPMTRLSNAKRKRMPPERLDPRPEKSQHGTRTARRPSVASKPRR